MLWDVDEILCVLALIYTDALVTFVMPALFGIDLP